MEETVDGMIDRYLRDRFERSGKLDESLLNFGSVRRMMFEFFEEARSYGYLDGYDVGYSDRAVEE